MKANSHKSIIVDTVYTLLKMVSATEKISYKFKRYIVEKIFLVKATYIDGRITKDICLQKY